MDLTDELVDNLPGGDRQGQAVIICLQFPIGKLQKQKALNAIFELDAIIREVIETSGVGTYDGNEFCEGEEEESVTFYIHGDDAAAIYQEIAPILDALPSLSGYYIIRRYSQFTDEQVPLSS